MRRAWSGSVGVVLTLLATTGRADDDVVWRAIPGAKPVVIESPAARTGGAVQAAGLSTFVPAQTETPRYQPIGPPRIEKENPIPGAGSWGSGSGARSDGKDDPPVYNLIGEHGLGQEAPPIDPGKRIWMRAEFLAWWMRPPSAPPLVSTVVPNLVPGPLTFTPGAIGTPGQQTVYGGGPVGGSFLPGARFTAGAWMNDCQTCALEGRFFFLGPRSDRFQLASSAATQIIARPIFAPNVVPPLIGETAEIVAIPPGFILPNGMAAPAQDGTIAVDTSTFLWGAEVNAREALWVCGGCDAGRRIDLFAGFRYLDLQETLRVQEDIVLLTADLNGRPPGSQILVVDFFGTRNQFYGGQVGVSSEFRRGRWFAEARAQLALGVTHQTLTIDGFQVFTPPPGAGPPVFDNRGGLLAIRGANIGRFTRDRFSVVPEVNLNVGYQLTTGLRAFFGYSFLYWSNVIRPGNEIDRVVDVTRVPNFVPPGLNIPPVNPPRPAVRFQQTDFWAQGVNVGMELKW